MVRYLTMSGKAIKHVTGRPFPLRYRRVNRPFCESVEERRIS
jgi:hypothetical protein